MCKYVRARVHVCVRVCVCVCVCVCAFSSLTLPASIVGEELYEEGVVILDVEGA